MQTYCDEVFAWTDAAEHGEPSTRSAFDDDRRFVISADAFNRGFKLPLRVGENLVLRQMSRKEVSPEKRILPFAPIKTTPEEQRRTQDESDTDLTFCQADDRVFRVWTLLAGRMKRPSEKIFGGTAGGDFTRDYPDDAEAPGSHEKKLRRHR